MKNRSIKRKEAIKKQAIAYLHRTGRIDKKQKRSATKAMNGRMSKYRDGEVVVDIKRDVPCASLTIAS